MKHCKIAMLPFTLLSAFFIFGGPSPAVAAVVVNFEEVGGDVVATYSGTIDLSATDGHVQDYSSSPDAFLHPEGVFGSLNGDLDDYAITFLAKPLLGPGSDWTVSVTRTGDSFMVDPPFDQIWLPDAYLTGQQLTGTATFTGTDLSTMGLATGTYTLPFVSEIGTFDFVSFVIGSQPAIPEPSTVPEPSAFILAVLGVLSLGMISRRRRRR